jgi:Carboxypeptidase regulatory-like domain
VTLVSAFAVSGRITDTQGRPVAGARVYFVEAPVATPDIAQVTDADGRFSLVAPAAGHYRVGVNAPGGGRHQQDVEVAGGSPEIEIELKQRTSP